MQSIHLRNVPPPLETYDHFSLLSHMATWLKPERYLELGLGDGRCFCNIASYAKEAVAVDIRPLNFQLPANATYNHMTTDAYFDTIRGSDIQFDMVFIDADHSFEQSYQDFLNVKDYVIPDGFVFFHDVYPYDQSMVAPDVSGTCYKTPIEIRKNFPLEWEIVTLPFNPGVAIAKKINNISGLPWMK